MIVRQFLLWARTAPDEARARAAAALARAYLRSDLGINDRAEIETALVGLAEDAAPEVRLSLAAALADHPLVPADIVLRIVTLGGAPAAVILARSPVPRPAELMHICRVGDEVQRVAIAARRDLPAEVAATLSRTGGAQAALALLGNASAALDAGVLSRLAARHGHVPAVREALLGRGDLPAEAHQLLIREVAGALTHFVAERRWLSPAAAAQVAREACADGDEAPDAGHAPGASHGALNGADALLESAAVAAEAPAEMPAPPTEEERRAARAASLRAALEKLKAEGKLSPVLALRALLSGEVVLFRDMAAVLGDLPTEEVASMLADRSGRSFRTVYDRIGLPRGAYIAFRTAIEVLQARESAGEPGDGVPLKRRILDEVMARYAAVPGAERLLATLSAWRDEAKGTGLAA